MSRKLEVELHRATMDLAKGALKVSLVINGGAAIALLAFIGNIWSKGGGESLWVALAYVITYFSLGLLAAAVAVATAYFRQLNYSLDYMRGKPEPGDDGIQRGSKTTTCLQWISVLLVFTSLVLFGFGVSEFFDALINSSSAATAPPVTID